jgi:2-deoxy-D-gluconate 3-dehydrogenase
MKLFDLSGRTALVTGAATGLGQAMAVALAEAGASVVGTFHQQPPEETAARVRGVGGTFDAIRADLGHPDCLRTLADAAADRPIDILVNNAGIIRRADLPEFSLRDWDDVLDVNLKSMFVLSQSVASQMIRRRHPGRIINIASMLSYQGGIRVVSYTASKHGVVGLTRAMANELAPHGIAVNAIAPGYMITDNTAALRSDAQRNEAILARIPAGRWGEPSDLAGAVVFLASDAARYVHGITLPVDGGWLSR